MRRHPAEQALVISRVLLPLPLAAAQPAKGWSPANVRRDKDFDKVINKQEQALERAKKRRLRGIDPRMKLIQASGELNADQIRIMLQHIDADRKAFDHSDRLPTCDELINFAIGCLASFQTVTEAAEACRGKLVTDAVKTNDPTALARLEILEMRLAKLRLGSDLLKSRSKWKGQRYTKDGSLTLRLIVDNREGAIFTRRLAQQVRFGRPARRRVEGEIIGRADRLLDDRPD